MSPHIAIGRSTYIEPAAWTPRSRYKLQDTWTYYQLANFPFKFYLYTE